jgi:cytoskeletal protein CcmA (bactofilin family)
LTGDVITHRISVEEGAILKGGVEVRTPEKKDQKAQNQSQNQAKQQEQQKQEAGKTMAAGAGAQ